MGVLAGRSADEQFCCTDRLCSAQLVAVSLWGPGQGAPPTLHFTALLTSEFPMHFRGAMASLPLSQAHPCLALPACSRKSWARARHSFHFLHPAQQCRAPNMQQCSPAWLFSAYWLPIPVGAEPRLSQSAGRHTRLELQEASLVLLSEGGGWGGARVGVPRRKTTGQALVGPMVATGLLWPLTGCMERENRNAGLQQKTYILPLHALPEQVGVHTPWFPYLCDSQLVNMAATHRGSVHTYISSSWKATFRKQCPESKGGCICTNTASVGAMLTSWWSHRGWRQCMELCVGGFCCCCACLLSLSTHPVNIQRDLSVVAALCLVSFFKNYWYSVNSFEHLRHAM